VLILAFDTATTVATAALVDGETVLGERTAPPLRVLEEIDGMLREAGVEPSRLDAIAVGLGPGSFTGVRTGLAAARGLSLALDIPVAGVPTLDVLEAGAPDAVALIDAKRREVFLHQDGSFAALPAAAFEAPGRTCVGDGAVRYREHLEGTGALVPPDESDLHLPRARFHARLARDFGAPDRLQPIYVRAPDADRMFA
jgi:tRNA threonylcarbamoyl adenosine modification protein YeaZ